MLTVQDTYGAKLRCGRLGMGVNNVCQAMEGKIESNSMPTPWIMTGIYIVWGRDK